MLSNYANDQSPTGLCVPSTHALLMCIGTRQLYNALTVMGGGDTTSHNLQGICSGYVPRGLDIISLAEGAPHTEPTPGLASAAINNYKATSFAHCIWILWMQYLAQVVPL